MAPKGDGIKKVTSGGRVRWKATCEVPHGQGEGRRQTSRTFDTPEAAAEWRDRTRVSLRDDEFVHRDRTTVREWLDLWLEDRALHIRANTVESYRQALRPVYERLGGHPLQGLTTQHVLALQRDLYRAGGWHGDGHSPRTVNYALSRLASALEWAVRQRVVRRNVAAKDLVQPIKDERAEPVVWSAEQTRAFLDHVHGDRYLVGWVLGVFGLRRSEVLGLTWGSIDVEHRTVTITQARTPNKSGPGSVVGKPKSRRSGRTLAGLPDEFWTALADYRALRDAERRARRGNVIAIAAPADELLILDVIGYAPTPEHWSRMFQAHVAAAGLPRIPLHNLRHSLATTMHGSAVPVAFAASWLGHSPTMMLTVYTKADQKKAAQATGRTISDVIGWTAG